MPSLQTPYTAALLSRSQMRLFFHPDMPCFWAAGSTACLMRISTQPPAQENVLFLRIVTSLHTSTLKKCHVVALPWGFPNFTKEGLLWKSSPWRITREDYFHFSCHLAARHHSTESQPMSSLAFPTVQMFVCFSNVHIRNLINGTQKLSFGSLL